MPAKDFYHDSVRDALVRDGWTITHDPFTIPSSPGADFAYPGADRALAAEKGDREIVVDVMSFSENSVLRNLYQALGRYAIDHSLLGRAPRGGDLYLAVTGRVHDDIFGDPIARPALVDLGIRFMVFDPAEGLLLRWVP